MWWGFRSLERRGSSFSGGLSRREEFVLSAVVDGYANPHPPAMNLSATATKRVTKKDAQGNDCVYEVTACARVSIILAPRQLQAQHNPPK